MLLGQATNGGSHLLLTYDTSGEDFVIEARIDADEVTALTAPEVEQLLRDTARDLGEPGFDPIFGWGMANAKAALDALGVGCAADWDGNGIVNAADVGAFLSDYFPDLLNGTLLADFNGDGVTNASDVGAFLSEYFPNQGACP